MSYRVDVFAEQFPIVKRFVFHLVCYRELREAYRSFQSNNVQHAEFWTLTIDAHLLQAVNHWCIVFGADGSNPTHWKNLSDSDSAQLQMRFRSGLEEQAGLASEEWREYWNNLKGFRDRYSAHRELKFGDPVPDLTPALRVARYYDGWVRDVISPATFDELPLEQSEQAFRQSVAPLVAHLVQRTRAYVS